MRGAGMDKPTQEKRRAGPMRGGGGEKMNERGRRGAGQLREKGREHMRGAGSRGQTHLGAGQFRRRAEILRARTGREGQLGGSRSRSSTSPNSLSDSNENSMSRPLSGLLPTTPSRKSRQNLRFF
jgi:hypothetical protein